MPLSEFLRMAKRKLDSDQQKPSQTGFSNRGEDELVELVWENGQIMMQGQSSRPARNPGLHNSPKFRGDSRTEKLGDVESMLNDLSPVVPSGDLDLSQDDEMVPWLNYQVEDSLPNYCNEFLPEISGVTVNGQNSFVSPDKKSNSDQNKARLACSWPPQLGQTADPSLVSGVSDIVSNNMSKGVNNCTGTKEAQNNMAIASNSSNFLNFSHFSRPGSLVKSNLLIGDGLPAPVKGSSVKSRLVDQLNAKPKGFDFPGPSSSKTSPAERAENLCRENLIKKDKPPLVRNNNGDPAKGVGDGERSVEPMMASSSVGSGNSGDRISCEQTHNSKRKFHDIEESEGHGDDIETESVGLKKLASGRGGGGSKRGRAAEVHNLSERRRRDRINEKMRALQELIPNCNKADKASMLDEAIEYLKTLQLQVQMMSMGAGLCMPPMMFPPGIHPAHLPHFSHMGVGMSMGMGMGMGYGMGMADMNVGSSQYPMYPAPPMQGAHFPSPMPGPVSFQRLPSQVYGHHPSQGIPTTVPLAPNVSSTARAPITSAIDSSALQTRTRGEAGSSMNPNLLQPTKEVSDKSAAVRENKQVTDGIGTTALTPTKSIDISEVAGGD